MENKKVVIITGASSGIGKATALMLVKNGYKVYGISRGKSDCKEFVSYQGDVNDEEKMCQIFEEIFQNEGHIDVLINNAGFGIAGAIADTKKENIENIVNTNLTAVISLCSKIIPYLKKSGGGKIVNISSVGGIIPLPFQACYSATKAGVEVFSRALAGEVKQDNIKVTAILPGDTKTGFTKARIIDKADNSSYDKRVQKSVGKMAKDEQNGKSPDTVAKVILKVLKKKNPPLRKSVGAVSKLEVFLTRVTSTKFVNRIVRKIYG